jgi:hypothetical protein
MITYTQSIPIKKQIISWTIEARHYIIFSSSSSSNLAAAAADCWDCVGVPVPAE